MDSEFFFEKASQRFKWRKSKKYISQETVHNLREKAISQSLGKAETAQSLINAESATQKMLEGEITVDEWERDFAAQIKTRTLALYQLGKPGQLDATDRGRLGKLVPVRLIVNVCLSIVIVWYFPRMKRRIHCNRYNGLGYPKALIISLKSTI